jgi:hypothetical protein
MLLKQVLDILELLDRPDATGSIVARLFAERGLPGMEVKAARSRRGSTSFIKLTIPGTRGKAIGGKAPTLGIIGFLGGVGARPEVIGLVSDADGAVASLAAGLKLVDMYRVGDRLDGDVILCTHISPNSPIIPHEPVPFMSSPVSMATMKRHMVDERMDAVLSLDTTKGNRIINTRGFAISPTIKEGYILRVSEDLLTIQQNVTGRVPSVFAITTQDLTPFGNRLFHLNSILQPASATNAPVVGVAITTEAAVPGCASGASHEVDIELAARFVVEVAKGFGRKSVRFYDAAEFSRLVKLYGSMKHLQTMGHQESSRGGGVRKRTRVRRDDE